MKRNLIMTQIRGRTINLIGAEEQWSTTGWTKFTSSLDFRLRSRHFRWILLMLHEAMTSRKATLWLKQFIDVAWVDLHCMLSQSTYETKHRFVKSSARRQLRLGGSGLSFAWFVFIRIWCRNRHESSDVLSLRHFISTKFNLFCLFSSICHAAHAWMFQCCLMFLIYPGWPRRESFFGFL